MAEPGFITVTGDFFTTPHILKVMTASAPFLVSRGNTLRTGARKGPDQAWVQEVDPKSIETYLPWRKFNDSKSDNYLQLEDRSPYDREQKEYKMIEKYLAFDHSTTQAIHCHAAETRMLLGTKLNKPSKLLIYYHDEAKGKSGNTFVIVALAQELKIPCFNLADQNVLTQFCKQCKVSVPRLKE